MKDGPLIRAIILTATVASFPVGIAAGVAWIAVDYLRTRQKRRRKEDRAPSGE